MRTKHAPLTDAAILRAEKRLGIDVPQALREQYENVANGGFGPGGNVLGLVGGATDDNGESVLDLYERWFLKPKAPLWPEGLLPIAYEGCALYVCVDAAYAKHPLSKYDGNLVDFSKGAMTKRVFLKTAFSKMKPSLSEYLAAKVRRQRA